MRRFTRLETLLEDKSATPEDLFQLAQMYRSAGAWPQASTLFRKLMGSSGTEPRYLSVYITALMEHNEVSNAEAYLDRLESAIPNHITAVGLRAELLVAKDEPDKALDLLKAFVDNRDARPPERNVRVRLVAETIEQIAGRLTKAGKKETADRFVREAETLYRVYVDQSHGQDSILVAFLGRQGRIDAALDVLNRIWDTSNPAGSPNYFHLLQNNKIGKEQLQRLDGILQSALKHFDRPIPLLMRYADLCTKQARYPVAEGCYREVILKAPGNASALNNLALLLALQGSKLDEAMKLINQAVEIAGPVGAMLDSRATVYLALGESDKALGDLADALADAETPVRLFHQAQAYDQAGKQSEAATALERPWRRASPRKCSIRWRLPPSSVSSSCRGSVPYATCLDARLASQSVLRSRTLEDRRPLAYQPQRHQRREDHPHDALAGDAAGGDRDRVHVAPLGGLLFQNPGDQRAEEHGETGVAGHGHGHAQRRRRRRVGLDLGEEAIDEDDDHARHKGHGHRQHGAGGQRADALGEHFRHALPHQCGRGRELVAAQHVGVGHQDESRPARPAVHRPARRTVGQ